jgi:transposase-like protein
MEKKSQRWTAERKVELLLQLIRGETKLVDACREHDLKQSEVESWMETFLVAGERGLKARSEDEQVVVHERELRELRAKVGELVLELDARQKLAALTGKPEKAF